MPSVKYRPATITFFQTRKFLGTKIYMSGDIPGARISFSTSSGGADIFEEIMEVEQNVFNQIIAGADISKFDFSPLINLLNGLNPVYDSIKNFLLDTLTIANSSRVYKQKAINIAEQLEILQDEYEELLGKYEWLQQNCGELEKDIYTDSNVKICTHVEVDMDTVYILYQHFFGYPKDGIWDEEKANMIRRQLINQRLTTIKDIGAPDGVNDEGRRGGGGGVILIRHNTETVKIKLERGPSVTLQVGKDIEADDTLIKTNSIEVLGDTEINVGIVFGQQITIGYGGPNPEIRTVIGFGSILLNKPLNFSHPTTAIIIVAGQSSRFQFLNGKIIKVNGKFESYDIQLDIGGIARGVQETSLEDGKPEHPCADNDNDNITEYICPQCSGDIHTCGHYN